MKNQSNGIVHSFESYSSFSVYFYLLSRLEIMKSHPLIIHPKLYHRTGFRQFEFGNEFNLEYSACQANQISKQWHFTFIWELFIFLCAFLLIKEIRDHENSSIDYPSQTVSQDRIQKVRIWNELNLEYSACQANEKSK